MTETENKNWWGRNWKWFVPVGILGAITLFVVFIALILSLVYGMIKSSDVYKDAVVKAKTNISVQQAIGTPIEEGFFTTGSIRLNNSSGHANLSIPIHGPLGEATVYAIATKSAGKWTYSTLVVEIERSKKRIKLIQ